jgi:hypothetical protein
MSLAGLRSITTKAEARSERSTAALRSSRSKRRIVLPGRR